MMDDILDHEEQDITFIGIPPSADNFAAKANFKNIAMLEKIISEQNHGREVYNIKPIPFTNEVIYELVDETNKQYHTTRQLSLCEYLSTLFVVFVGG